MKSRAAVALKAGQPLEITEIDVQGPQQGEVLVRMVATGVCHTDAFTLSGSDPEGLFPSILGHEGGGIVEEVGAGVTSVFGKQRHTVDSASTFQTLKLVFAFLCELAG